jgi:hypothetical protein
MRCCLQESYYYSITNNSWLQRPILTNTTPSHSGHVSVDWLLEYRAVTGSADPGHHLPFFAHPRRHKTIKESKLMLNLNQLIIHLLHVTTLFLHPAHISLQAGKL